jgi:hypothetical protein
MVYWRWESRRTGADPILPIWHFCAAVAKNVQRGKNVQSRPSEFRRKNSNPASQDRTGASITSPLTQGQRRLIIAASSQTPKIHRSLPQGIDPLPVWLDTNRSGFLAALE